MDNTPILITGSSPVTPLSAASSAPQPDSVLQPESAPTGLEAGSEQAGIQLPLVRMTARRTNAFGRVSKILGAELPSVAEGLDSVFSPLGVLLQRGLGWHIMLEDSAGPVLEITTPERLPSPHLGYEIGPGGAAEHYEWVNTPNDAATLAQSGISFDNDFKRAAARQSALEALDVIVDEMNRDIVTPLIGSLRAAANNERGWQSRAHDLLRGLSGTFKGEQAQQRVQHFEDMRTPRDRLFYQAPNLLVSYKELYQRLSSGEPLEAEEREACLRDMAAVLTAIEEGAPVATPETLGDR